MDIREIKERTIELRRSLKNHKINGDLFILYGSYATGRYHKDSDIDIAVISRDFGKDRFKEGSTLNYIAQKIDVRFEAVPVSLEDYLSQHSISPLLAEIDKHGIALL